MNNLPVNLQKLSKEELMQMTGQSNGPTFTDFPRLSINKDIGDEPDTHPLPVGSFVVGQNGIQVFSKTVSFRPFINAYQYAVYDDTENKYTNKSIIFKNFSDEALDEKGGVACGRVPPKKREGLSEEQLKVQKKIKCYRILFGTVTFSGTTAYGEKVEVTETPVKLRLSGSNFMPLGEVLEFLNKKKVPMITVPLTLSLKRDKQGTNVWYVIEGKVNLKNPVELVDRDWGFLQDFQEAINDENNRVLEKHKAITRHTEDITGEAEVISALDNELNDDVSDVGE